MAISLLHDVPCRLFFSIVWCACVWSVYFMKIDCDFCIPFASPKWSPAFHHFACSTVNTNPGCKFCCHILGFAQGSPKWSFSIPQNDGNSHEAFASRCKVDPPSEKSLVHRLRHEYSIDVPIINHMSDVASSTRIGSWAMELLASWLFMGNPIEFTGQMSSQKRWNSKSLPNS
jgi:hypothetical protein